ncbi:protein D2-like [Patiria miniata]|uniref:Phosphatidylethanolamine-binding protein n=1 Tax=Patiria miniata TaxID=46514 RepID=A0A913Z0F9_PATMI|nr:protein D2-like [Patiria miniata]
MEAGGVVPDVIDVAPATTAEVTWDSGVKAEMGNVVTPTQVQKQPIVTWPAEEGALYTIIMTDPDAPSRANPKFREWRHWLAINVSGNNMSSGSARSEYIGAGPPKDTGLHRYVILIYKQSGQINPDSVPFVCDSDLSDRAKWKVREFAQSHSLGNPVAGNFVQAEYDDYVPKLYARAQEFAAKRKQEAELKEK